MKTYQYALIALALGHLAFTVGMWAICDARRLLTALYFRRAKRIQEALSTRLMAPPVAMGEAHAFTGWVTLLPEGKIEIAGNILDPTKEAFEVTARDESHISRATVTSNGKGMLLITSHGIRYAARWENSSWRVESLPDQKSLPQGG